MTGTQKEGRRQVSFKVESRVLGDRKGEGGAAGKALVMAQWPCVSNWSREGWGKKRGEEGRESAQQARGSGDMGDTGIHSSTQWGPQVEFEGISLLKGNMVNKYIDEPGSQTTWYFSSNLLLLTLNKLLDLHCVTVSPSVYEDNNNIYLIRLLRTLNELIFVKWLAQCPILVSSI